MLNYVPLPMSFFSHSERRACFEGNKRKRKLNHCFKKLSCRVVSQHDFERAGLGSGPISSLLQHSSLAKPLELISHATLFCLSPWRQRAGCLRFHTEAAGRNVEFLFEGFAEMGGVVESPGVGDIGNRVSATSGVAKIFPATRKSHSQNQFGDGLSFALKDLVYVSLGAIQGGSNLIY